MQKSNYEKFEKSIGYSFSDQNLLHQALTHRSFTNEHTGTPNNERLEFLGDTVLQYIVTDFIYKMYPDVCEGTLSLYRTALVKTEFLITLGKRIALDQHLRTSVGQRKELEERQDLPIIADGVEALIGAIYIDGGFSKAKRYIDQHILNGAQEYLETVSHLDPKTSFQEFMQGNRKETPRYIVESEEGPSHNKIFTVAVMVGGKKIASGKGKSKQEASQMAAQKALEIHGGSTSEE